MTAIFGQQVSSQASVFLQSAVTSMGALDNPCAARVVNGAALGGALGASIGAGNLCPTEGLRLQRFAVVCLQASVMYDLRAIL